MKKTSYVRHAYPSRFFNLLNNLLKKSTVALLIFSLLGPSLVVPISASAADDRHRDIPNDLPKHEIPAETPEHKEPETPTDEAPEEPKEEDREDDLPTTEETDPESEKEDEARDEGGIAGGTDLDFISQINAENDPFLNERRQSIPEIDTITGALSYSYDFSMPPGRNGLTPKVSLRYNNQEKSHSIVGMGWSLDIPYIKILNKYGNNRMYNDKLFMSSTYGELVVTATSTGAWYYRPKVEEGNFSQFKFENNTFTVTDQKGMTYKFGLTVNARQSNPSNVNEVAMFLLEEVKDTNNNFIKYEYEKINNQIYPKRIIYTGHNNQNGPFEMEFEKEVRDDRIVSYATTFEVKTDFRISKVKVKSLGEVVREYELDYGTSSNGLSSLLKDITETAFDEETGDSITLPATVFTYEQYTPGWEDKTADYTLPTGAYFSEEGGTSSSYNDKFESLGNELSDVNGDSLPDWIRTSGTNQVFLNKGNGTWATSTMSFPNDLPNFDTDTGVRILDINSDGLVDVVNTSQTDEIRLNNGTGWPDSNWTMYEEFIDSNDLDQGYRFVDLNGDGLIDIQRSNQDDDNDVFSTFYAHNGTGFNSAWNENFPVVITDTYVDQGTRMADINSDGLIDVAKCGKFYFNKKNINSQWIEQPVSNEFSCFQSSSGKDNGGRFVDLNADGLIDYVRFLNDLNTTPDPNLIYLNNGVTFVLSTTETLPLPVAMAKNGIIYDSGSRLEDLNGDSLLDIIQYAHRLPDDASAVIESVMIKKGKIPDVIKSIKTSTGAKVDVEYTMSSQYKSSTSDLLNPKLPLQLQTVSKISVDDQNGVISENTYTYEGGLYHFTDAFNRRYAGFHIVTKTDAEGNYEKTYYHQGDATNTTLGEISDHVSKFGKPYRIEKYDSNGNLFSVKINSWERVDKGNSASYVKLAGTADLTFDGDTDHKDRAQVFVYDDLKGVPTMLTDYGEVNASGNGTFTDVGSDKTTTTLSYASNASSTLVLLSETRVNDQSGLQISDSFNYYDNLPLGIATIGNNTSMTQWVGQPKLDSVTTQRIFNSYGLVDSVINSLGQVTSYFYDQHFLYPTVVLNNLDHETDYIYDYSSGNVIQATDPNGAVYKVIYDALDRVVKEERIDTEDLKNTVTLREYEYHDTLPRSAHKTTYLDDENSIEAYAYIDALGRIVQTRTETEYPNVFSVTDSVYDERGLKVKESLPHFAYGSTQRQTVATPSLWTTTSYDSLGRLKTVANVLGTTTNTYDDWKLIITDAKGIPKELYKDGRGNVIKIVEYNDGSTYTSVYEYNPLNNLTRITDTLGNTRKFTYDGLSRKYSVQDLHAPTDSTFSTWYYTYDAVGNLTKIQDGKLKFIEYTYDDLNRPLSQYNASDRIYDISYDYDNCEGGVGGIGRMCVAHSEAGSVSYKYDILGRVVKETREINGQSNSTQYEYDRQGNVTSITLPKGEEVIYVYNKGGLVESISLNKDSGSTSIVSRYDYSPEGRIIYQKNGNKIASYNIYDPEKLYRLTRKISVKPGNIFQQGGNNPDIPSQSEVATESDTSTPVVLLLESPVLVPDKTTSNSNTYQVGSLSDGTPVYETTFFNPPANEANDSGYEFPWGADATVKTQPYPGSWDLQHPDSVGRNVDNSETTSPVGVWIGKHSDGNIEIRRAFYAFDTKTLPDEALILTANLKLYNAQNAHTYNDGAYAYINVYEGKQASSTQIVNSDIDNCGSAETNPIPWSTPKYIGSTATASTTVFALNFQAAPNIKKDGYTQLCLREGHDAQNIYVANPNSGVLQSYIAFNSFENSATSTRPKLEITWVELPQEPESNDLPPLLPDSSFTATPPIQQGTKIQDVSYTYDAVGNITKVIDTSNTSTAKTVSYEYDDLNRLISAASTGSVSGQNFQESYIYNAVGNILSTQGMDGVQSLKSYLYQGNTGNNFANPHAVTSYAGSPVTYDKNGNTLSGYGKTFTWDYHNKIKSVTMQGQTTNFAYDHTGERVLLQTATENTIYPSKLYNITTTATSTTETIHIFGGEDPIATVETTGTNNSEDTKIYYTHQDHLGSSSISTDEEGKIAEVSDYYPYGTLRISESPSDNDSQGFREQRKFTGHEFDSSTDLTYMMARYYNSQTGKFLSQDPINLFAPETFLFDPQQQNSYSYSRNNPLRFVDPTGQAIEDFDYEKKVDGYAYADGEFVGSYKGINSYGNGGDYENTDYQCTTYADQFISQEYGAAGINNFSGNGNAYIGDNFNAQGVAPAGSPFVTSYNGEPGNTMPAEDGIIAFGPTSKYGHVAVIGAVSYDAVTNKGTITLAEQNAQTFMKSIEFWKDENGTWHVNSYNKSGTLPAIAWSNSSTKTQAAPVAGAQNNATMNNNGKKIALLSKILGLAVQLLALLK
jgi:RHS repeat-associated protein